MSIMESHMGSAEIASLLRHMDAFCDGRLAKRVNIDEYAGKLHQRAHCLAAEENGRTAGVLFYYKNDVDNELYITFVSTDRECWGTGLASRMMARLKEVGAGYGAITLEVDKDNARARRFYEKEGFKQVRELQSSFMLRLEL